MPILKSPSHNVPLRKSKKQCVIGPGTKSKKIISQGSIGNLRYLGNCLALPDSKIEFFLQIVCAQFGAVKIIVRTDSVREILEKDNLKPCDLYAILQISSRYVTRQIFV
uniref:Uncharacterized protein n=1 Tax=Cacopsylla melanoneura TaxID=428564 RepID=A0A8D8W914_9HEMI